METQDPVRFLQLEVARLRAENRELKDELSVLRSSVRALSALQSILEGMTPSTDVIVLLDDLLAAALAVVGASDGSLLLLDEDTGELVFAVVHGEARSRLTGYRLPPSEGIAGWVVEHKRPAILRDVRTDPRFSPAVDEAFSFQTRSMAAVPLLDGDRILGVVEALNKTTDREFASEDNDLLQVVAQMAATAILRAESFTETEGG